MIKESGTAREGKKFKVESHRGRPANWETVRPEVFGLYRKVFKPIYENNPDSDLNQREIEEVLHDYEKTIDKGVSHESATTVFLRETNKNSLVGLTYTTPAELNDRYDRISYEDFGDVEGMESWDEHQALQKQSLEVGFTMIDPEHSGKGGWSMMMKELETKIADQTEYPYLKRSVRTGEGYDQIVEAHIKGVVVHTDKQYSIADGEHKLFWIKRHLDRD